MSAADTPIAEAERRVRDYEAQLTPLLLLWTKLDHAYAPATAASVVAQIRSLTDNLEQARERLRQLQASSRPSG